MNRLQPLSARIALLGLAAGIMMLATYLRSNMADRQQDDLRLKLDSYFAKVSRRIEAQRLDRFEGLAQMAGRAATYPDLQASDFEAAAVSVMRDRPDILALGLVDSSLSVKYAVPSRFAPSVERAHEIIRANRMFLLSEAMAEGAVRISEPMQVASQGKVFLAYFPVKRGGRITELILAVLHLQYFLDTILEDEIPKGFAVQILDGYQPIYFRGTRVRDARAVKADQDLSVLTAKWRMRLWPDQALVDSSINETPKYIFWAGLATALLLAGLVIYQTLLLRRLERDEEFATGWRDRWDEALNPMGVQPAEARGGEAAGLEAEEAPSGKKLLERRLAPGAAGRRAAMEESSPWLSAVAGVADPVMVTEPAAALDAGTPVAYVNAAFEQITGFAAAEILGKTPRMLYGARTDKRALEEIRQQQLRRQPHRLDLILYRKDGSPFHVKLAMRPVMDEFGQPSYWIFLMQDITEPLAPRGEPAMGLEAESAGYAPVAAYTPLDPAPRPLPDSPAIRRLRALREGLAPADPEPEYPPAPEVPPVSEPAASAPVDVRFTLAQFLEASPLAAMACDLEGRVVVCNRAAERLLGWPAAELMGQASPLLDAESLPAPGAARRARGEDGVLEAEIRRRRKDGAEVDLSVWAAVFEPGDGADPVWIAYFASISDRKRAQEELARREEHFRTLIERTGDLVAVVAPDSTIHYLSPAVERILGFQPGELAGSRAAQLLREADRPVLLDALDQARRPGAAPRAVTLALRHKDGSRRMLESVAASHGEGAILLDARDITARLAAQASQTSQLEARLASALEANQQLNAELERARKEMRVPAPPATAAEAQWIAEIHDAVTAFDGDFRVVSMNPAARRLYGVELAAGEGFRLEELLRNWRQDPAAESLRQRAAAEGAWSGEVKLTRPDGEELYLETALSAVRGEMGAITGYAAIERDITARKRAEEALRASEERYALAARSTNDGLFDWNLVTEEIYYSPRWKAMLGYAEHDIAGLSDEWFMLVHPDDAPNLKSTLARHLKGQTPVLEAEYRIRRKDGAYVWMLARAQAVFDDRRRALRLVGSQSDISEQKAVEDQLLHEAFHDALTGLPNRVLFSDRLGVLLDRARHGKNPKPFAVLFLDIDGFKTVNDSLGHLAGDELIIEAGRRLQACVSDSDTLARYGGDEFTILLDNVPGPWAVQAFADKIQRQMAAPVNYGGHEIFVTFSVGSTLSSLGYERPHEMLRDADTALYQAKARGRARHTAFDKNMHAAAKTRLELEGDLRRALERREFEILYQPLIALGLGPKQGRLAGFEALVRWRHPRRGILPPDQFLPLAEETGLILDIDRWVLRESCIQMRHWQVTYPSHGPLHVSVNLSGLHFTQIDLAQQIRQILKDTQLNPEFLRIELTESTLVKNTSVAAEIFRDLREIKVQLNLDDFGTGYSSLSYLAKFPIDRLKLDQSFVQSMHGSEQSNEMVRGILMLARNLRLNVVAEGVETPEQLDRLRAYGCEFAQGFLFALPMLGPDAGALIETGRRW